MNCKDSIPKKDFACKPGCGLTLVIIPAQSGDSEGIFAPKFGDYRNTVVKYLADSKVFVFDKDGNYTYVGATDIPGVTIDSALSLSSINAVQNKVITKAVYDLRDGVTAVAGSVTTEKTARQNADNVLQGNIDAEALARQNADGLLQTGISNEILDRNNADAVLQGNIDAEALTRANAITGVETKINRDLMNGVAVSTNASTVSLTEQLINPLTGVTSTNQRVLPTATVTSAGTISAADYQAIVDTEELTQAILEGAVAIAGISPTATQADLTNAWLTATGRPVVINRASIYDIDNQLIWTYYTNASLWYSATASISIGVFTNSTAGTILGSSTDGNVSANVDGTGTVSGWSTVKNDISSLQTNKADASSLATVATTGNYSDLAGTPTVPVITLTTTDPGAGSPLAANNFIAVYEP